MKSILICLDGSVLAEQIIPYAVEHAVNCRSKIELIQVMKMPSSLSMSSAATSDSETAEILSLEMKEHENDVKTYLESIARDIAQKGVEVKVNILQPSHCGEAIVSYAQNNKIDLICLATHGHSGLGRAVYGSVADYVIRKSGLPIMLIKPG